MTMNEKILVLDDEPLILNTIQRALGKKGYDVLISGDATDFMDKLAREKPNLLIMDVNLGPMRSLELIGEIKRISPASKILIISGVIHEIDHEHFLEKPFRIDELRQKVREILDAD
jgi:two-component system nitrogen regulation response regulator NtrX